MTDQQTESDDVLPFDSGSDIHDGIGNIEKIVDLNEYRGAGREDVASGRQTIDRDGRCRSCGYDRGTLTAHTEMDGYRVECRECGMTLVSVGPL